MKKEKEKQAEKGAKESLKLAAGGKGSGLRYPHAYGRDASPYFYGAFLVPVPLYGGGLVVGGCVASDPGSIESTSGGCGGGCGGGCNGGGCSGGCKSTANI